MDPFRRQKVDAFRASGKQPYASSYPKKVSLQHGHDAKDGKEVITAGRIMLWRDMGKLTFATLQDQSGRLQIALRKDVIGEENYKEANRVLDLGDFIGIKGERFTTQKGEPTVLVKEWTLLSKALRQPPEKWHGIADRETSYRQRYLDMMSNRETFDRMIFRSNFIRVFAPTEPTEAKNWCSSTDV